MNPQDDPEARIRELEQPLANYGATELGTEQSSGGGAYLPPPVPGPTTYGNPYAPPGYGAPYHPPAPKSGPRTWPFLVAGILVVLVVFGAGAVFVIGNVADRSGSITSVPSSESAGGGGSFDKEPGPPVAEPAIPSVPGKTVTAPPPGRQLSVSGVGENKSIVCNASVVSVSGVNNTVTITGHCAQVSVSGVDNQVTLETAGSISASGFDNRVVYHSGSPQVNATGSNVVEQG